MAENTLTFAAAVKEQLNITDKDVVMKTTKEDLEKMQSVRNASNAVVSGALANNTKPTPVQIAEAINSMANPNAADIESGSIFVDQISTTDLQQESQIYPCAAAKAANIATARLVDSTVIKAYAGCTFKNNSNGEEYNATLKDGDAATLVHAMFSKPLQQNESNHLVKNVPFADLSLSTTLFPQDLRNEGELVQIMQAEQNLKLTMIEEYYQSISNSPEAIQQAVFLANRSMVDSLIEAAFISNYGQIDPKDAASVAKWTAFYKSCRKIIAATIITAKTTSINFGLSMRKMSISPEVIWTNTDKLSNIKQLQNGSKYVSSNLDTGYQSIPTSIDIVSKHAAAIDAVVNCSIAFVEAETRAQCGIAVPVVIPLDTLKKFDNAPKGKSLAACFGIQESQYVSIISSLKDKIKSCIKEYAENQAAQSNAEVMSTINKMLGGK